MPGIKILNIQKNDTFDKVFDTFKETDAQEVIFIFPRGTVFAKNAGYLQSIGDEAKKIGKTISVMSADPVIEQLATSNGIKLLQNPAPRRRVSSPEPPVVADLAVARKKTDLEESKKKMMKGLEATRKEFQNI